MRFDASDSETWPKGGGQYVVKRTRNLGLDVFFWDSSWRDGQQPDPLWMSVTHYAPSPSFSEPSADTVEVRIAVAVAPDGDWGALGYITEDDSGRTLSDEASDMLDLGVKAQVCFATARVPAYRPPAALEVAGEVEG